MGSAGLAWTQLEGELAKMGMSSGRTRSERERRTFVEARVDELGKEVSRTRTALKHFHQM